MKQHIRAFVRTVLLSLRPWRLWTTLKMEHEVHAARLACLTLIGAPLTYILVTAPPIFLYLAFYAFERFTKAPAFTMYGTGWNGGPWTALLQMLVPFGFSPRSGGFWVPYWSLRFNPATAMGPVLWFVMPFTFLLLPTTLRRSRVKRSHIWRIWAYSLVFAPLPVLSWGLPAFLLGCEDRLDPNRWSGPSAGLNIRAMLDWLCNQTMPLYFTIVTTTSALFWGFAASRYLKLPRAWAVAIIMALLALLIAVGFVIAVPGWGRRIWLD